MVGDEACGKDLDYYASVLREAGVPVIMHAGESVDPANGNIGTALQLGISRIGHGLNLYLHPEIESKVKETGVMLEVCPLSNQLLGYIPDLSLHPAAGYIKRGLNVTINSDDCAIFDTAYITDDLLAAYLCWNLSLADIKRCLLNSLQGNVALTSLFEEQWKAFENSL
jgi:adenosine deaminase CECR1